MKRVLIVAKGYPPQTGGIETYSAQLAGAYRERGFNVCVLTAAGSEPSDRDDDGIRVIDVGAASQARVLWRMLAALRRARRERSDFDLVHTTTWRVAVPLLLLGWPVHLLTIHAREVFVVPPALRPIMRQVLRRACHVVFVSSPVRDGFEARWGYLPPSCSVSWNGTSGRTMSNAPVATQRSRYVFTVCRLVDRKNVVQAVRAIGELARAGRPLRFVIAGEGPERAAIEAVIVAEGVSDRVECVGFLSDDALAEHYASALAFVHPQSAGRTDGDIEGFGIAIADAMAAGCAVIAGASGGPLDFVQHGKTGLLVDGADSGAIAKALEQLMDDPSLAARLGTAAQRFCERELTWARHLERVFNASDARTETVASPTGKVLEAGDYR